MPHRFSKMRCEDCREKIINECEECGGEGVHPSFSPSTKEHFFNILNECIPDTVQPEQMDDLVEDIAIRIADSMIFDMNEDPQYFVEACLNSIEGDDSHIASVARIIFENMWTSFLDWELPQDPDYNTDC
jgi:hypothetical protein